MADSNKAESGVLADVSRSLGAFFSHRRVKPTWTRLSISPRWLACPNSTHRRGTPLARASASRGLDLPKGLPALRHPDSRPRRSRCTGSSLARRARHGAQQFRRGPLLRFDELPTAGARGQRRRACSTQRSACLARDRLRQRGAHTPSPTPSVLSLSAQQKICLCREPVDFRKAKASSPRRALRA